MCWTRPDKGNGLQLNHKLSEVFACEKFCLQIGTLASQAGQARPPKG